MTRLTKRVAFAIAKIDPSFIAFAAQFCDAHWLHRCFGGC